MEGSRKPLNSVAIVFAGFILLALISQLSSHVLGQAILSYHPAGTAGLVMVQHLSTVLAVSASGLGLMFSGAALFITRKRLGGEAANYMAAGLPPRSVFRLLILYHSLHPLRWAAATAVVAVLADVALGLAVAIPLGLAIGFVILLFGWLTCVTLWTFSRGGPLTKARERAG
jgi:hypothetical protein